MSPDTKVKLAELSELTIGQLAAKYEKLFGEKCRSRNRRYVYRRVAWKTQADDEGGLSEEVVGDRVNVAVTRHAATLDTGLVANGYRWMLKAPSLRSDPRERTPKALPCLGWRKTSPRVA